MSEGVRIEIEQRPDFDAVKDKVILAVQTAMESHVDLMKGIAEGAVREKTQTLKGSIEGHTDKYADKTVAVLSANARSKKSDGSAGEMYGVFNEYGTGERGMAANGASYNGHVNPEVTYLAGWPGISPQPFLRPALYNTFETLKTNLDHAIERALK